MRGATMVLGLTAGLAGLLPCNAARAQATARDAQLIVRTLTFLTEPPQGAAVIAIPYMPGDAASVAAARQAVAAFAGGVTVGHLTATPQLVATPDLAKLSGVVALFMPDRFGGDTRQLAAAARRLHVPLISTNLGCVEQGACTVGFSAGATVQIELNHAACAASGIEFIQAFRMLVKEI
ncbi:MAG TPA: hypothetical protein VMB71_02715 [Acetobacteraceae bacterium]|nr:hypothetical protein [Acetobacteraceae bacterium]